MKIYVASPRSEFPVARHLARDLAEAGHTIVSTWHQQPDLDDGPEPTDIATRRALLERCERDIAQVMVAWTAQWTPRMTIAEIAIMLRAQQRTVSWIQGVDGAGGNILDADDLVTVVSHDGDGERTLAAVLAEIPRAIQRRLEQLNREEAEVHRSLDRVRSAMARLSPQTAEAPTLARYPHLLVSMRTRVAAVVCSWNYPEECRAGAIAQRMGLTKFQAIGALIGAMKRGLMASEVRGEERGDGRRMRVFVAPHQASGTK